MRLLVSISYTLVYKICDSLFLGCAVGKKWRQFGFAKKWFSVVRFQFLKINCGFGVMVWVFALCHLMCAVYWRLSSLLFTELVQLIVSQSDLRCGMKKNTLTVDPPVMLENELWMRQRDKPPRNHRSRLLKTELQKLSFRFWNIWGHFVHFGF